MLAFEIKKLIKSKVFLFTIIFSIIMSFYINYKSNKLNLTIDHPTYKGNVDAEAIFAMNFFNQYYKLENKEEAFFEYNETSEKYSIMKYPEIQLYIVNRKKQTFTENYNVAKIVQDLHYNRLEDIEEIRKKYDIQIEDANQKNDYEYGVFESKYYHDNNILFTRANLEFLSTNYTRIIIYNRNIIFGLPFLIFMIISFYRILSKEKDEGTINLLKNQPKRNVLLSKLYAMIFIAFIYIIGFLIFFLIICKLQEISINGFKEIYRVFNPLNEIKYFKAYQLIALILITYFVLVFLISTFILFINVISSSKEASLAVIIVVFGLAYTLTENNTYLQNSLNPIYALDYLRLIIGKIETIVGVDGSANIEYINHSSLIYFLIYGIYSSILFALSIYIFNRNVEIKNASKINKIYNSNIFNFEIRKIMKNDAFIIYILGALVFVFSLYYFQIKDVENYKRYLLGESGKIKIYQEEINKLEDELLYTDSDLDRELINEEIRLTNKKLDIRNRIIQGYKASNTKEFYLAQIENTIYEYDVQGPEAQIFKYEKPIIFAKFESKLLDEMSIKNDVKPIIRPGFQYSAYEKFFNPLAENQYRNRETYLTNSSLYTNYKMLKYNNLDILFLLLILFMVLGGYTYDKENGNQLNLIYTQPIDKFKFHIIKILSQTLVIALVYVFISLFIFLMGIIKEGLGELNQPVIEYLYLFKNPQLAIETEALKTITTIPIYIYLIKVFIVIIFQTLFVSSISTLISIFTKSKTVIIVSIISISTLGLIITKLCEKNIVKLLNPFTYIFANNVADNSVIAVNGIEGANYIISLTVLFISAILIAFVGGIIAKTKVQI